jgi:hypothetical protein
MGEAKRLGEGPLTGGMEMDLTSLNQTLLLPSWGIIITEHGTAVYCFQSLMHHFLFHSLVANYRDYTQKAGGITNLYTFPAVQWLANCPIVPRILEFSLVHHHPLHLDRSSIHP